MEFCHWCKLCRILIKTELTMKIGETILICIFLQLAKSAFLVTLFGLSQCIFLRGFKTLIFVKYFPYYQTPKAHKMEQCKWHSMRKIKKGQQNQKVDPEGITTCLHDIHWERNWCKFQAKINKLKYQLLKFKLLRELFNCKMWCQPQLKFISSGHLKWILLHVQSAFSFQLLSQ